VRSEWSFILVSSVLDRILWFLSGFECISVAHHKKRQIKRIINQEKCFKKRREEKRREEKRREEKEEWGRVGIVVLFCFAQKLRGAPGCLHHR
jgi:hypothetical protein